MPSASRSGRHGVQLGARTWTILALVSGLALSVPLPSARAATATDTFQVTATIADVCSVDANDLNFGTYNPFSGTALDGSTTLIVACTLTTAYTVGLDAGTGTGATVAVRKMLNGANALNYSLYQNNPRTVVWGNTVGTNTVAGTGSGGNQTLTAYGRIPAGQTLPAGTYTDTVTVQVLY